jgi:uncharacterized membrane protein
MALKARLISISDRLESSLWFLPSLMALGAVLAAYGLVAFDEQVTDKWLEQQQWAYTGGAEGASAVLGTIAGSMINVAGVVFSLTLVALTLASSQFGPRMLRNFMRDRTNQFVLGTFVATFLYCLIVLRTIRHEDESGFVPHVSITVGVVLAMASLLVLIYFIHHVSLSIHADEIVARVADELIDGIDRLFPEELGEDAPGSALPGDGTRSNGKAAAILAGKDGYLQLVDANTLMSITTRENMLLKVERRPGHYVVKGGILATVLDRADLSDEILDEIRSAFVIGRQRTPVQDIEFTVLQLVEIAVRALSPGINDPFTAITCVDRLGSALSRLASRQLPTAQRVDDEGKLRVIASATTFAATADAALNQIRQHARTSAAVTIRLLETIAAIAPHARRRDDRDALRRHAEMIVRSARDGLREENDRAVAEERFAEAIAALGE